MRIAETERLVLRTWTTRPDDLAAGLRIWGDPEVMRWVGRGDALDAGGVEASIAAGIAHQEQHGVQHWAVVERASGEVIGACGFHLDEGGPGLEMVFHLAKAWWGRGLATEAARAAFEHVVRARRPPEIVAAHRLENEASGRILAVLGFEDHGVEHFEDSGADERIWIWRPSVSEAETRR